MSYDYMDCDCVTFTKDQLSIIRAGLELLDSDIERTNSTRLGFKEFKAKKLCDIRKIVKMVDSSL